MNNFRQKKGTRAMIYQCPCCQYCYDEHHGAPHEGYPPGTLWSTLPEDWRCPDCCVREKADFIKIGVA